MFDLFPSNVNYVRFCQIKVFCFIRVFTFCQYIARGRKFSERHLAGKRLRVEKQGLEGVFKDVYLFSTPVNSECNFGWEVVIGGR